MKKGANAEVMLQNLVRALAQAYAADPSKPGVIVSLTNDGWYAAIHRFTAKWGEGRLIVCNAKAGTLSEAIEKVAREWLAQRSAYDDLRNCLGVR